MACNFHKIGGFVAIQQCLDSPHASLRSGGAHLVGEGLLCSQLSSQREQGGSCQVGGAGRLVCAGWSFAEGRLKTSDQRLFLHWGCRNCCARDGWRDGQHWPCSPPCCFARGSS